MSVITFPLHRATRRRYIPLENAVVPFRQPVRHPYLEVEIAMLRVGVALAGLAFAIALRTTLPPIEIAETLE